MNPIIKALQDDLAIEQDKTFRDPELAAKISCSSHYFSFLSGHEAACDRLLPLIEKAMEMAEFYESNWRSDIYVGPTEDLLNDFGKKAREFLVSLQK